MFLTMGGSGRNPLCVGSFFSIKWIQMEEMYGVNHGSGYKNRRACTICSQ